MKKYLDIVKKVLDEGKIKKNRTGVEAKTVVGAMIQHDMSLGFPLLTTKKIATKSMMVELEFFIKGKSDKKWLQNRGCKIWNEWCNPKKIPKNLNDQERKEFQKNEDDLGPIYGVQWRNFDYCKNEISSCDQLKKIIDTLKKDPNDRRMIVSAWNPKALDSQALPPCHVLFHVTIIEDTLNLSWFQRSCDLMLGVPFNLASYSLLLHLLAKTNNFKEGYVTGFLSDVHIYTNHIEGAQEQLKRTPKPLPSVETDFSQISTIFDWNYTLTTFNNYKPDKIINFEVAV